LNAWKVRGLNRPAAPIGDAPWSPVGMHWTAGEPALKRAACFSKPHPMPALPTAGAGVRWTPDRPSVNPRLQRQPV